MAKLDLAKQPFYEPRNLVGGVDYTSLKKQVRTFYFCNSAKRIQVCDFLATGSCDYSVAPRTQIKHRHLNFRHVCSNIAGKHRLQAIGQNKQLNGRNSSPHPVHK